MCFSSVLQEVNTEFCDINRRSIKTAKVQMNQANTGKPENKQEPPKTDLVIIKIQDLVQESKESPIQVPVKSYFLNNIIRMFQHSKEINQFLLRLA